MTTDRTNETQAISQPGIPNKPAKFSWNKGKLVGQKPPLKLKEVWEIRIRLQLDNRIRELALFNLAIDSKLRSCDLVKLKVRDIAHGEQIAKRAMVMRKIAHVCFGVLKNQQPYQPNYAFIR